jgi:hypothetical protein
VDLGFFEGSSMMRPYLISLAGLAALWPLVLVAQSPDQANDGVRVGDRWVYDTKDEITGFPKETYTQIVTEVSKDQIVTSLTFRGKPGSSLITFGSDWGVVDNALWKFKPNNGQGIPLPLAVGKEWRSQFEAKNTQNGTNLKGSTLSKVVAKETSTTSAGTFDTFKIGGQAREFNTADPSRISETEVETWFAPQINRWVRRTILIKIDKRVRTNTSEELADFSRNF